MSCSTVASGLAAIGTGLELFALGRIVWRPWLLPKLRALRSLFGRLLRRVRRLWPFGRSRTVTGQVTPGGARAGGFSAYGYAAGPMDTPDEPLEERFAILLRRVENIESWVAKVEQWVDAAREHASREAAHAYERMSDRVAEMERTALRVRVNDALVFAVGVAFTLAGAVVGAFC